MYEYEIAKKENELVAWVLIFGKKINHFGISVHLLNGFNNLEEFNDSLIKNAITDFNKLTAA